MESTDLRDYDSNHYSGLPMKITIPYKSAITLGLLLAVASVDAFSLFIFTRLDHVVHSDLYSYGLQFNPEWAESYWANSKLLTAFLAVALIATGISIALSLVQLKTKERTLKLVQYPLLTTGLAFTVASTYFLNHLDHIVHSDLYGYGLQFSYEWATQYWAYAQILLGLLGFGAIGTLTALTLVYLSQPKRIKINATKLIYTSLITTGIAALTLSIIYTSSILAFIGLGLLFWGTITVYIRTEEYTKKTLLDATAAPSIATLNQLIDELDYQGRPVYLPPKYLKNPEDYKTFIPKEEQGEMPTPEQTREGNFIARDPDGLLITPPGAELAKLFEKELATNFTRVDLPWLQQNMPKLLIEDLEISRQLDFTVEKDRVHLRIAAPVLTHPLGSAIACALAKASGKPVVIESQEATETGTLVIEYTLIDEEESRQ